MEKVSKEQLQINQRSIYVEIHGARHNPWVLMLHHGLGTTQSWKKQIPALVQAGFCVMLYDRWGYGRSQRRGEPISPQFFDDLQDLEQLLDQVAPAQIAIVGHSDGGTIGLYFASRHPEQLKCLVVIAAHIYVEKKMDAGINYVKHSFLEDQKFQKSLASLHAENYPSVFWNWYAGWRQEQNLVWDMRHELAGINCPTLVVQGTEDEHATCKQAEDLTAAVPGAQLWLMEDAGHMLPQTHAQVFNQRLVSFLNETIIGADHV
jgi:pimeloyl-ACP methyl ester carboxylesterase